MGNRSDEPSPPDTLSETLVQRVDSLDIAELKDLRSYVERRIESLRTPLTAEIEANAAGEVLKVENHGTDALVRKHPPDPEGPGVNTDLVSLYRVRREPQMDGTESLRWTYLGDVSNAEQTRCGSCGGPLDEEASACPHCGNEPTDVPETEE